MAPNPPPHKDGLDGNYSRAAAAPGVEISRYVPLVTSTALRSRRSPADRRTPVVAAGDRAREAEQAVGDPVVEADHAAQDALVGIQAGGVGHEVEAMLAHVAPRHRPAQHERRRIEALLRRALDVRRRRRVLELLVRLAVAADDVVALLRRQLLDAREIVHPALRGDEAAAGHARLAGAQRDLGGARALGDSRCRPRSRRGRGPRRTGTTPRPRRCESARRARRRPCACGAGSRPGRARRETARPRPAPTGKRRPARSAPGTAAARRGAARPRATAGRRGRRRCRRQRAGRRRAPAPRAPARRVPAPASGSVPRAAAEPGSKIVRTCIVRTLHRRRARRHSRDAGSRCAMKKRITCAPQAKRVGRRARDRVLRRLRIVGATGNAVARERGLRAAGQRLVAVLERLEPARCRSPRPQRVCA